MVGYHKKAEGLFLAPLKVPCTEGATYAAGGLGALQGAEPPEKFLKLALENTK